jgi:hypothetical protein
MGGACGIYGGEERCIQRFGGGNLRGNGLLGDLGIDSMIVLGWILKKSVGRMCTGLIWLRIRKSGRPL